MTTKKISSDTQNPLQDFNPYFFAIEKWAIEKWYIPVFLPFVIAKLIALPLYFAHEPDTILNEANDVIYLSVAIVLTLVVLLYAAWVRQIPGVFLKMKNQLIRPRLQNGVTKTYDQFLKEYLKALHSRVRFLLLLLFLITLFIILVNMLYNPINPVARNIRSITLQDDLVFFKIAYVAVFYVISPLIWASLAAVGGWIMSVTAWYLLKLPRNFEIKVEARHPDKCGGLSFLGDFCLSFSYPILISTILLAILGVAGEVAGVRVAPAVRDGAMFGLIFFAMPLLYIAFFVPVWGIHNEMVVRGKEFLEIGAGHVRKLEKKVDKSIQNGNFTQAKTLSSELDSLVSYYSSTFPVWPFDKNTILKFVSPQILPVLGIIFRFDFLTQANLTTFLNYLIPAK